MRGSGSRIWAEHPLREHLHPKLLLSPHPLVQNKTENQHGARGPQKGRRARGRRGLAGGPRGPGWSLFGGRQARGRSPYCFSGAPLTMGPYRPLP